MTMERLTELAQYNRLGRAGGFMTMILPPTADEMDEVFELAKAGLAATGASAREELTDALAKAILVAAKEDGRRPTSDAFEWYGSADDMAAAIVAALRAVKVLDPA